MTELKTSAEGSISMLLIRGLILMLGLSVLAQAQQPPENKAQMADRVLVIRNANSAISRAVADDYVKRRGISHVLTIACPDSAEDTKAETIRFKSFQVAVEAPLGEYLATHPGIDFIVLTKGIPIRLADAPQGPTPGPLALDSYLASWQYEKLPDAIKVEVTDPSYGASFHGMAWANRFWDSRQRFSHARFGGYLVTRLDGYNEADAKALTTRSLAAEKVMLLRNASPAKGQGVSWKSIFLTYA